MKHYILFGIALAATAIIIFIVIQLAFIRFNGSPVPVPEIPRNVQTAGSGEPLAYAIMGDSTSISQGSDYAEGFAAASVAHLGRSYSVRALNTGISGATSEEVERDQLAAVLSFKPEVVLLATGANDSTHFVRGDVIRKSIAHIVEQLRAQNPNVKIVVTASPAMDSVTRFPDGAKQLMGLRYRQVNKVFNELIKEYELTHAPIAEKTRDAFIADPSLTASDNFHPNARGYALWIPVINDALDKALN
jgi:lysophospholipase L1-like esterase